MAKKVLIIGESGTGKSASMRNFAKDDIFIINVAAKDLPFREPKGGFEKLSTDNYREIKKAIQATKKKVIVIDDTQYLMANEYMRRATEKGFDKYTEMAQNMWDLQQTINALPNDVIVYELSHLERDDRGNERAKTIGKLMNEKITFEGMFSIVLKAVVQDGKYYFQTQNNGADTCKSPIGLFKTFLIDNDLKAVDAAIRAYYDLNDDRDGEMITEPAPELFQPVPAKEKSIAEKLADFKNNEPGSEDLPKRKVRSAEIEAPAPQPETSEEAAVPVRRRRRIINE